ncbi:MAG: RNase P subunit p30 family protein [archaeon]
MFIDIAIPSGNEEEFIEKAKALGTNGLIFLYEKDDKKNLEKIKKLTSKDFKVFSAVIDKMSPKYDFIFSKGERQYFENKKIDVIFNLENNFKKDKHHYRNSGLNQVLCSLAKENKITLGFNFNLILKSEDSEMMVGRMKQNVHMSKKYKVKMLIASFAKKPAELRYWSDLISFGIILGMNPKIAKDAVLNRKV